MAWALNPLDEAATAAGVGRLSAAASSYKKGDAWVKRLIAILSNFGFDAFVEQVVVEILLPNNEVVRTTLDIVGIDEDGKLHAFEGKDGPGASLTPNQRRGYLHAKETMRIVIYGRKSIFKIGRLIGDRYTRPKVGDLIEIDFGGVMWRGGRKVH